MVRGFAKNSNGAALGIAGLDIREPKNQIVGKVGKKKSAENELHVRPVGRTQGDQDKNSDVSL